MQMVSTPSPFFLHFSVLNLLMTNRRNVSFDSHGAPLWPQRLIHLHNVRFLTKITQCRAWGKVFFSCQCQIAEIIEKKIKLKRVNGYVNSCS